MKIVYFERLTLVDYPGKLAATVFTLGCPFRCPFCHSPELVDPQHDDFAAGLPDKEEEFFAFLAKRRGKLDGICVTGGEPTLNEDLSRFIRRVKELGFAVKVDTNGLFPERIEKLLEEGLVDYWAMDIKHAPEKYSRACGVPVEIERIERSVQLLMARAPDYEFRTTAVPGLHAPEDFVRMARFISGSRRYFIQPFRDRKVLAKGFFVGKSSEKLDLKRCADLARQYVGEVKVR